MIAKIIPLKRLPRHLDIFDYAVPPDMQKTLLSGQLVTVPLRKSTIFGLVFEIIDEHNDQLKPLEGIVHTEPLVSLSYLTFAQTLSKLYGISWGTILHMGLLPLQKRKVKTMNLTPLSQEKKPTFQTEYHYYSNKYDHSELYCHIEQNSCTLIIVPEIQHIDEILSYIPKEYLDRLTTWTSDLSTKEKFSRWLDIRNGEKNIILGTRSALLLPYPKLSNIIIDFEHDENIKHWDQAPRFHGKDVALLLAHLHGAQLTYASFSPSFDSYFDITKRALSPKGLTPDTHGLLFSPHTNTDTLHIVNIQTERINQNYKIFAESVQDRIQKTSGNIFISLNRKGYATAVGCNDCGHIETDPETELPLIYSEQTKTLQTPYGNRHIALRKQCPKCASTLVRMLGIGTELVEKYIYTLLGEDRSHDIIRIDSNQQEVISIDTQKPHIIIGTSMALKYVNWDTTDLIISLDIDRQLAIPEYTAIEQVWHDIQEILYRKKEDSVFIIQTARPDHVVFKSLHEKDRIYRTELQKRKKLGYPPYTYLARYFFGANTATQAQHQCDILVQGLRMQLTKAEKNAIISAPYDMYPRYFRSHYWYGCIAKIERERWLEDTIWINAHIPNRWKIDPRPISVLSP